jgi:IS30 family transposase
MKNKKQLTLEQRYETEVLLRAGKRQKETAEPVGKDQSVISRELKRNSHKWGYSARLAQEYADDRRERFRRKRSFTDSIRRKVVKELTQEQWSPEQIVGRARRDGLPTVSHERICQFIREDKKEGGALCKHLRHRLKHRKRPVGGKKVIIPDKVSIDLCPDIINQKERFGDREIDTVVGSENKGAILTATERTTGFLLMKKLPKGKMQRLWLKSSSFFCCLINNACFQLLPITEVNFTSTNVSQTILMQTVFLLTHIPPRKED